MELKQPWRLWQRKRHLRSELALFQTSTILFHLVQFVQWFRIILVSNRKGLQCLSKLRTCLVFSTSTKLEVKKPHVVIIQRRQRNVHKSEMHGYNLLFATLNLLFFYRFRRHFCCLLSPIYILSSSYLRLVVLTHCSIQLQRPRSGSNHDSPIHWTYRQRCSARHLGTSHCPSILEKSCLFPIQNKYLHI